MIILLNLGSLVLGLLAWILPIINLIRYRKHDHKNWIALSIMSISAGAISLCFQIFEINYRVKLADWSALMDTMSALVFASAVFLIITIILNVITLIVYRDRAAT